MRAVNVLITCSNKKSAVAAVTLGSVKAASIHARAELWTRRLLSGTPSIPANELYAGEHWSVVKTLAAVAKQNGIAASVWICSAGYGLVSWSSPLHSYAATFAAGHPDSVALPTNNQAGRGEIEAWWTCLSNWSGPRKGDPRSLTELAKRIPSVPLIVAVSPKYLQAISKDLVEARQHMHSDAPLIVLTCDERLAREFAEVSVLCDARLQSLVRGPRNSLNVRILRHLIGSARDIGISVETWRNHLSSLTMGQPPMRRYDRQKLGDREIGRFIRAELKANPKQSHTVLLRKLRDGGSACEQGRFRNIYSTIERKRI